MEHALHLGGEVIGGTEDQVLEPLVLEHAERHVGGVAQMLAGSGRHVVASLVLGVAVVVVVAPGQPVEQSGRLDQLAQLEHEHPGALAIDEEDPEALVLVDHLLELAHARGVIDHHLASDGHGQLDHSPELVRRAREHGEPPGARAVEAPLDVLLDPAQIAGHRGSTVLAGAGHPQQPVELSNHVLVADPAGPVDVEIERRHRCELPSEARELTHLLLGDGGHGTSWLTDLLDRD